MDIITQRTYISFLRNTNHRLDGLWIERCWMAAGWAANHESLLSDVFMKSLRTHHLISGRGGGARVFVACKLFFYLREKTIFFWAINVRQFVFMFRRMLSLLCTLPFGVFSGQHIFHQFQQQTFFSVHIFNKLFFLLLWRQTIYFNFFLAPPPDI